MSAGHLSEKQQLFVSEYLVDLNATAAAQRAGYKEPNVQGHRLLVNAGIQQAIALRQQAKRNRLEIESDDILRELLLIARSDIGDILDFTDTVPKLRPCKDIPAHARKAISSIKVKAYKEGRGENAVEVEVTEFKLWDKLGALDKLAKYLKLLDDPPPKEGDKHLHVHLTGAEICTRLAALIAAVEAPGSNQPQPPGVAPVVDAGTVESGPQDVGSSTGAADGGVQQLGG